ncbi:MAG: ABC transporter ATP-binding protein [Methanophagales archaeon ANME-1-THS]|nr:MAG: ABC transporter ATP-binding protein [Methanophagales archaeon ANME-1-THS]
MSPSGETAVIQLEKVWKIYQMGDVQVPALRGIDLEIERGEFLAIAGASGSGKSTMMNLIGCLDLPSKGKIRLDGTDIATLRESQVAQIRGQKIGFVFQQFNLIPTLTALENVMLPLEFQNVGTAGARARALELLKVVGLGDRVHHLPSQLSGGQQQRVAIARALAVNPDIILADEPTGNLDSKTGAFIMNVLSEIYRKDSKTIILVTHDFHLVKRAERIVYLNDGQIERIEYNNKARGGA